MDLNKVRTQLLADEDIRLKPYLDTTGNLTIGVGRKLSKGVRRDEAMFMLDNDIAEAMDGLNRHVPWWTTLSSNRQDVLIMMAFNLGISGLLTFKKMLIALEARDYDRAADEMLDSSWRAQVGMRAVHLAEIIRNDIEGTI